MEIIQVGDFKFSLDLSKPLYEQVLQHIRQAIARGDVQLGTKLPSVRDLALQLKLNPNTVMRAYQELDRDHLTETRRGQGTFITTDSKTVKHVKKALASEAVISFVLSMEKLGIDRSSAESLLKEVTWHE
ncbi:GntR family transcriptional regulator [Desulfosporosinus fructosivorans]|uniref:GntR family transcriptional regulator n=1 Tax=Desulfosporosinus fructosivorans TaxID=2018669 RepID=A0A4Z0R8A5_9FIRM|nr:GntR family transcriptional regulator [Desulfosporosinus fructosivorans]TGE38267.1 GntR family transcriptional regulator [Desulfosporosinus fructosivorans]